PYLFIISISSCGTEDEPCITRGTPGIFSTTLLIISMSRVGFTLNLYAPWLVPIARASETRSPVIIQASRGALKYTNMAYIKYLAAAAAEDNPDIPIVLHLDHGNSLETCKEAIKRGIRKINVDTDGRLAMTGAIRKYLGENPDAFDPRTYFGAAREAVYQIVKGKMIDFGTTGHAGDYKPMTLEEMKRIYK
ncbi:unnamed protein product, partial [marine sediment metagenome]